MGFITFSSFVVLYSLTSYPMFLRLLAKAVATARLTFASITPLPTAPGFVPPCPASTNIFVAI